MSVNVDDGMSSYLCGKHEGAIKAKSTTIKCGKKTGRYVAIVNENSGEDSHRFTLCEVVVWGFKVRRKYL